MARLGKLTPEQEARIPEFRERFLRVGLSTEPADFDAAEQAAKEAYQVAGLAAPKLFIRLRSPLEGAVAAAMLSGVWGQVRDQVRDQVWHQVGDQVRHQVRGQVWGQVRDQVWGQVWDQVRDQVMDQVWHQVWDQVWDQVRGQVWGQVRDQVRGQVWGQVRDQVRGQVWGQVWGQISQAFFGQHEAGWLSLYAFFAEATKLQVAERLEPLTRLSGACGWCWLFRDAVILTDRPERLSRDEAGRLHAENGAALKYRDGFSVHAWHGTSVPAHWLDNRSGLDPREVIKAANVEQRAAGAAIVGWPKMLDVLKSKTIDAHMNPEIGELIELTLPGLREPGRFLKATCPRNGLIVEGVPRVSDVDGLPINTAIAAQAWRIGDPQSEFIVPPVRT